MSFGNVIALGIGKKIYVAFLLVFEARRAEVWSFDLTLCPSRPSRSFSEYPDNGVCTGIFCDTILVWFIIPDFKHFLQSPQSDGRSPAALANSGSLYDPPHHLLAFPTGGKGALHPGVGRLFFAMRPE